QGRGARPLVHAALGFANALGPPRPGWIERHADARAVARFASVVGGRSLFPSPHFGQPTVMKETKASSSGSISRARESPVASSTNRRLAAASRVASAGT